MHKMVISLHKYQKYICQICKMLRKIHQPKTSKIKENIKTFELKKAYIFV